MRVRGLQRSHQHTWSFQSNGGKEINRWLYGYSGKQWVCDLNGEVFWGPSGVHLEKGKFIGKHLFLGDSNLIILHASECKND